MPFVPANVPAEVPAQDAPGATAAPPARKPKYLTRTPDGWRFQMRLPVSELQDSFLAKSARTIRVSLGPMAVRKAEILAQQLATLCRITVGMARYLGLPMTNEDLFDDVVKACTTGIQEIRKHPENAMALARGLGAVHKSLSLVAEEMAKGSEGMPTIVGNAPALVQEGLSRVLALSGAAIDPGAIDARSLLATIGKATSLLPLPVMPPPPAVVPGCPTFGEVSGRYIELRRAMGASKGEIDTLQLRRKTFLDVIGDRPVDDYSPSDLQRYVIRMQHWPVDANKRIGQGVDWDTKDILDANSELNQRPMALKTVQDGYVANIKTMMRFEMVDRNYRDPFSGARIRWPSGYVPSKPREGLDEAVLNRVFELGCASGQLDEAILPLFAFLTGRRLGLLIYLRGSDIREKHGVIVAQTAGITQANGVWKRVPIKTGDSATFFVLHDLLVDIGFADWARKQGDSWLFAAAHEHSDPSKYTSKAMSRLLERAGAKGENIETFHSLRGDAISVMRSKTVQSRAARLQVGHELKSEHDKYGFKALNATEARKLAKLKLAPGLMLEPFRNLDFDRLATGRRQRGRKSEE